MSQELTRCADLLGAAQSELRRLAGRLESTEADMKRLEQQLQQCDVRARRAEGDVCQSVVIYLLPLQTCNVHVFLYTETFCVLNIECISLWLTE